MLSVGPDADVLIAPGRQRPFLVSQQSYDLFRGYTFFRITSKILKIPTEHIEPIYSLDSELFFHLNIIDLNLRKLIFKIYTLSFIV